jgi:hypothetical protein
VEREVAGGMGPGPGALIGLVHGGGWLEQRHL